ncbi:MAG: sortase [Caldiserica bacterium]|jgi:sortase A|nr:sortase [Caldisericota bacterium]MDH7561966.1 sortase [Caldisericota bacterium]
MEMKSPPKWRRKVLKGLAVVLIIAGMVFLLLPFYPAIRYYLFPQRISPQAQALVMMANTPEPEPESSATPTSPSENPPPSPPEIPEGPMIVIPKISLEARIVPDLSWDNLMAGVGHDPLSAYPGEDGTCVLYGHRFLNWVDPSSGYFYLLDKLEPGDLIVILWEGKVYRYIAKESKVIEPTDHSIYEKREVPTLVLVTCTPLWTDKYRLVVFAELESQISQLVK